MTDQLPQTQENQADEIDIYIEEDIVPGFMAGFQYDAVKTSGIHMSNYMMAHCLFELFLNVTHKSMLNTEDTIECAMVRPRLFQHKDGHVTFAYCVEPKFGYEFEMLNNFAILNKYKEEQKILEAAISEFIDIVDDACPDGCGTDIGEDEDGATIYSIDAYSRADVFRLIETLNIENVLYAAEEVSHQMHESIAKGASKKDVNKELKTMWKNAATLGGQLHDTHGPTGRKLWEMSLFENTPRVPGYEAFDKRILGLRADMATCRYSLLDIEQALKWEGVHVLQKQNNLPMVFAGVQ